MKRRFLAIMATVMAISMFSSVTVFAEEHWGQVGSQWFYYLDDGGVAKNTWIYTEGGPYWVKEDGSMAANNWVYDGTAWYYVDAKGNKVMNQLLLLNGTYYWAAICCCPPKCPARYL